MENPNDKIRDLILRFMYKKHAEADHPNLACIYSPKVLGNGDEEDQLDGYSEAEIVSNFSYLIQAGYVTHKTKAYSHEGYARNAKGKKVTVKGTQDIYFINSRGVDFIEGGSTFQRKNSLRGTFNITNINGITIIGNDNVVQNQYTSLYSALEDLNQQSISSESLTNEQKLSVKADIDTIKAQLAKVRPNTTVLQTIWGGLNFLSTIPGLIDLYDKVEKLIMPHIR